MTKPSFWVTDDARWQAIVDRNQGADGHFVYAVRTTSVYCSPSHAARLPKRENVEFFDTPEAAEQQGYRPSKRLRRGQPALENRYAEKIAAACRYIEQHEEELTLADIASHAGISTYHFHRQFKAITGLTPKAYASAHRSQRLRDSLTTSERVTDAIFTAGFNSNSPFYETSSAILGMTPKAWRAGGKGARIYFALAICSMGDILVAQSEKGICAILLGDDASILLQDLQDKFPQAELIGGDTQFEALIAQVVGFIEAPEIGLNLPLDIRGTAFQQRVWQALRDIPPGTTVSYTDIAQQIGSPKAVRAVAGACAANMLAVAIPCHRVVRNDGALSGYRWGIERKRALLNKESKVE
ncbi:bifunctional DNA-binding transcriptional regulator/O6-methylguanine-DNA methyltransferase Ada [Klebsiella sp. BIGb0407]|uniref:bifunctional DNA-binding transcriptional regulator/O6-methylguanine-DNA methyltransferase Ada n=1 Tax=Klebsiella sp. BIGb0407 TaxID=2940603 RepID=UPI0021695D80|nr:bifunctional DNA-binding transcriptional regulator/O6-methylguanine-DNA methyltransferase Ada [Klebsiella sp. BIGb0407]MCS3432738.1 AraC family transcriptional regulator of adaptative response/methylated-DNA-[protein]-cysteine methyltransferase [Klebsiella sp. BIGb0407]